jgi:putative iron-only hydrogenase system regulator
MNILINTGLSVKVHRPRVLTDCLIKPVKKAMLWGLRDMWAYPEDPKIQSDPEEILMEKRVGVVSILIDRRESVPDVNGILSQHHECILGRQGLPLKDKGIHVISLIVEGTTDEIGALTGKLGRLAGVQVKSMLTKHREDVQDDDGTENGHIH